MCRRRRSCIRMVSESYCTFDDGTLFFRMKGWEILCSLVGLPGSGDFSSSNFFSPLDLKSSFRTFGMEQQPDSKEKKKKKKDNCVEFSVFLLFVQDCPTD